MPDDELTRENVIAVSFSDDANAYEALSRLKQLDAKGRWASGAPRCWREVKTGRSP
jgi:hypothetical protein